MHVKDRTMLYRLTRRELLAAGGAAAAASLLPAAAFGDVDPWARAAGIAARVRAPSFPNRVFSILDHGAKGDGTTKSTAAIAQAIQACAEAGGGRVLVPAGRFLTGAIHLKSNVELHVAEGATLLFSTDPADYPIVFTRWEGMELMNYSPLVYAYKQKNIALTGVGTLDGQADGAHWWAWKGPWDGTVDHGWREGMPNQRPARARLFELAEKNVPVEQRVFGEGSYLRPAFVQPYDCENVLIEGVKLRGAPFWVVHPVLCRNIIVRKLDIMSHGPNTDGCDPESCNSMLIEDCTFDTGDDCIAVKSGRNADGRRLATPTQDVFIRRCRFKEGHGGITVGSEISGGVRNVFADDCHIDSPNLWYAIRFKNNALRGGRLENFYYRNLTVGQVGRAAITCDFNYEEGAKGPFKPVLRNIVIENLRAENAVRVLDSQGLPGAPVQGIHLRDCSFQNVKQPNIIKHTEDVTVHNVSVDGKRVTAL
jgi:polygalacturonase